MTSLFEILKASKTGLAPDLWTLLRGRKYAAQHSAQERELEGVPPLTFSANGDNLLLWSIYGNMQQTSTPTPDSPIYPSETGDRTAQLFDENNATFGYWTSGTGQTSSAIYGAQYRIDLTNISTLTVKANGDAPYTFSFCWYQSDNTFISRDHYSTEITAAKTATVPNNAAYVVYQVSCPTGSRLTPQLLSSFKIMLNTGSTALPYEPHGFKLPVQCGGVTTPVYTAEPLRKIGNYTDYKSESVEYRAVKKLVLTGGEVTTVDASVKQALISISGDLKASAVAPISSHYVGKVVTAWTQLSNGEVGLSNVGTTIRICDNTNATSATAFNNYLSQQYAAGTPVTVWYILATPTTESIEAPEIPTMAGSNTFDVDTTLKPSKVYIKYKG